MKKEKQSKYLSQVLKAKNKFLELLDFKLIEGKIYYYSFKMKYEYRTYKKQTILEKTNAKRLIWPFPLSGKQTPNKLYWMFSQYLIAIELLKEDYENSSLYKQIIKSKAEDMEKFICGLENIELVELSPMIVLNDRIITKKGVYEKSKYDNWTPFQIDISFDGLPDYSKNDKEAVEHYISIFAKTSEERKHFLMLFSLALSNYNNGVMTIIYGKSNIGKSHWFNWFTSLLNDNHIGEVSPTAWTDSDAASFRDLENKLFVKLDDIPTTITKKIDLFKSLLVSSSTTKKVNFRKLYSNDAKRTNCASFFASANQPLTLNYNVDEFRKRVKHFHAYIDPTHPNYRAKYDINNNYNGNDKDNLYRQIKNGEKAYLLKLLIEHFKYNLDPKYGYYGQAALKLRSHIDEKIELSLNEENAFYVFWKQHGEDMNNETPSYILDHFKLFVVDDYPQLKDISVNKFNKESKHFPGIEYKKVSVDKDNKSGMNVANKIIVMFNKEQFLQNEWKDEQNNQ